MPARLSLTKAQRDALLLLPDTEEAFVRHYSLVAEDIEIISGYRTPGCGFSFPERLKNTTREASARRESLRQNL